MTTTGQSKYLDLNTLALTPLDTKLLCLLKVGEQQHIESLADGKIYCRYMTYYKNPQFKDSPFYDEHEGLATVLQSDMVKLNISSSGGEKFEIGSEEGLVGSVNIAANLELPTFCLHAIHTGDWTHKQFTEAEIAVFRNYLQIPDEMFKFKNYVCVIMDFGKFLERLGKAIDDKGIGARHGFIRYVDLTKVHGKVSNHMLGFIKQMRHSNEREYRFIFSAKEKLSDPFMLDLGSLRDITKVMPLREFMDSFEVDFDPE